MVTTRGEAENVETGFANGCTDYVTKPINAPELLAKIRNLLGEMRRKPTDGPGSYVRKVHEGTQHYTQDLLGENERLRLLVATLEAERSRLLRSASVREDMVLELDRLREAVALLETEKHRAQQLVLSSCEELDGHRRERAVLERQVAEIEKESRVFREQFELVEAQNSNLANLYVASYRLHGTLDRKEVLAAIQEIVANLDRLRGGSPSSRSLRTRPA